MDKITHSRIASDYRLWGEYFDTGAEMDESEFEAMPFDKRMALLESAFGAESESDAE